jgi:hypothetical protein
MAPRYTPQRDSGSVGDTVAFHAKREPAGASVFALLDPRIAARRSPRVVAQIGLVGVSIGALVMLATLDVILNDTGFKVALALIGDAQLDALRLSLGAVALTALLSLWLTRRLPTKSLAESEAGATEATAVA